MRKISSRERLRVFVGTSANGEDAEACAYVYGIVVDGVTRYIGKGCGRRAEFHVKHARALLDQHARLIKSSKFYRKLAEAVQRGGVIEIKIFKVGLSDADAFVFERKLIGRSRRLWNTRPEQRHDLDWRQKHREAMASPEVRMKIGKASRLQWADPITRSRRMASIMESYTPERRAAISSKLLQYYTDPVNRAIHAARVRKVVDRPAWRAQRSKIAQELVKDPIYRAKISAGVVAACAMLGVSAKKRKATKHNWQCPAYRHAVVSRMRATKNTPEFRAYMSEKMREVRRVMRGHVHV